MPGCGQPSEPSFQITASAPISAMADGSLPLRADRSPTSRASKSAGRIACSPIGGGCTSGVGSASAVTCGGGEGSGMAGAGVAVDCGAGDGTGAGVAVDCGAGEGTDGAAVAGVASATDGAAVGVSAAGGTDGSTTRFCPGSPVGSGVAGGSDGSPAGGTGVSLCMAAGAPHAASTRIKLPVSKSMRMVPSLQWSLRT